MRLTGVAAVCYRVGKLPKIQMLFVQLPATINYNLGSAGTAPLYWHP
ncbi:MAG: hypothetical protein K0S31_3622 [Sphingobacterium multivorum]|jgi:hypothetical protein|nr:hypothetical protein [Sphingobacterium multivorum]